MRQPTRSENGLTSETRHDQFKLREDVLKILKQLHFRGAWSAMIVTDPVETDALVENSPSAFIAT